MSPRGVDCSGFVLMTFRDKFALQLPRETREQAEIGTKIDKSELLPGDLVFFKTGSGESGLHVGIYDTDNQFIHASTSQGVTRSSLELTLANEQGAPVSLLIMAKRLRDSAPCLPIQLSPPN